MPKMKKNAAIIFFLALAIMLDASCSFNPQTYSGGSDITLTLTGDDPAYYQVTSDCGNGISGIPPADLTPPIQLTCHYTTPGTHAYTATASMVYEDGICMGMGCPLESCGSATVTSTIAVPDTTPPAISSVQCDSSKNNTLIISWTTNEPATSNISFAGTNYLVSTTVDTSFGKIFNNLNAGTSYSYTITACDTAGNCGSTTGSCSTTSTSATIVEARGGGAAPSCRISASPAILTFAGSISATINYATLTIQLVQKSPITSWAAVFDCGNNKTASATCYSESGSCGASCSYDKPGTFVIKIKEPANLTGLCNANAPAVSVQFSASNTPTASVTPTPTATPQLNVTVCNATYCGWQNKCYPEGAIHPAYNDSGNCMYGICTNGGWKPKPEGSACGLELTCCGGQCVDKHSAPRCGGDLDCKNRRITGANACNRLKCTNPGACNSLCEAEAFPTCDGSTCEINSNDYCAAGGCLGFARSNDKCDCGENYTTNPDVCPPPEAVPEPEIVLNESFSEPDPIVPGAPAKIYVRIKSFYPLVSEGLSIKAPDGQTYSCSLDSASGRIICEFPMVLEGDYELTLLDTSGRKVVKVIKLSAAGGMQLVENPYAKMLFIAYGLLATGVLLGVGFAGYKFAYVPWYENQPPQRYKRAYRQARETNEKAKQLVKDLMAGKISGPTFEKTKREYEKTQTETRQEMNATEPLIGMEAAEKIKHEVEAEEEKPGRPKPPEEEGTPPQKKAFTGSFQ